MKYLLIDNCSLRHLIDNLGYSKYIQELDNLVSSNSVELITHELLVFEWNKHKDKWKRDKQRRIGAKVVSNENPQINELILYNPQITDIHLDEQIKKLDSLLQNAKIKLTTPEIIKNETYERIRKGLAPFHKKQNSLNDWEIFGSSANYCQSHGINQLTFISHNHTDFGHEDQIDKKIHSSLSERFNFVDIIYYRNINQFFEEFDNDDYLPAHLISYQIIPNSKYSFPATIKNNVLDGLYSLYKDKYSEITYIPVHIIRKCFPFATSENSFVYFSSFHFSGVNEHLVDFFDNIQISDNNEISFKDESLVNFIPDYKEKTEYVLRHITKNLIFHISGDKSHKRVCSHYFINDSSCNCFRCFHDRFDFGNSFQSIQQNFELNKDKLKQAYIHYQVGNYITANQIYEEILVTARERKEYILYFLAKYNQRHLATFLNNIFSNRYINDNLITSLKKIDPIEEAVKLKGVSDYNFLTFIAQEDFFNEAFQELTKIKAGIVDHYHSQLRGGWSSNSHITNLIQEFAKIDHLLNYNYIIYDHFSNFSNLFDIVIEGLFASHAITETQESRFEEFDNYWINKFIFYGSKKSIIKYFNRYKLKSLKYNELKSDSNTPFSVLARNLLLFSNQVLQNLESGNEGFKITYSDYFENLLTMAGLLELSSELTNEIAENILSFLHHEQILTHFKYESVSFFLQNKKDVVSKKILIQFFSFFLHNEKFHGQKIIEEIIYCFENDSFFEISDIDLSTIINESIVNCHKCKHHHNLNTLIALYSKVDKSQKELISKKINEKLNEKFNYNLFYLSAIYNIIVADKSTVFQLVDELTIVSKEKTVRNPFSSNDFLNNQLDELINLCFKLEIDTSDSRFEKFRGIHPYYDWLLNLDSFDYNNFDAEWVLIYQIKYYYKRMAKSKELKLALAEHLKKGFHMGIERFLIQITYYHC